MIDFIKPSHPPLSPATFHFLQQALRHIGVSIEPRVGGLVRDEGEWQMKEQAPMPGEIMGSVLLRGQPTGDCGSFMIDRMCYCRNHAVDAKIRSR